MGIIRALRPEDMKESLKLSQFAFQYELSPAEQEDRLTHLRPEETWGMFIEDQLAAKLSILPLKAYIGGQPIAMGGIAGVATWPEYRRGGLVGQLIHHALEEMRKNGQNLSMLSPFQFEFYRRYGWEHAFDYRNYEVSVKQLPRFADEGGRAVRMEDWRLLPELYETYASKRNGMLKRDETWWSWNLRKLRRKGHQAVVYHDAAGQPCGYILFQVKDRVLTVGEFVYLHEEARRGLWRFISNHDSMIERVVLQAESDDILPFLLADPRMKQELVPYFMARIVDVAEFLKLYTFQPAEAANVEEGDLCLQLEIQDEHAPWNEGILELRVDAKGHCSVEKVADQAASDLPRIRLTIQSLTVMLLGYMRPAVLHQIGRLEAPSAIIHQLEARLPAVRPYLLDFF